MTPAEKRPRKRPRLRHIPVKLIVSVDPEKWGNGETARDELPDQVRRYVGLDGGALRFLLSPHLLIQHLLIQQRENQRRRECGREAG